MVALARPCIHELRAYEHAHWDARFERLHANESPWPPSTDTEGERLALNRYPEPQPPALLEALSATYGVGVSNILATRGSDEGIDLLTRVFCEPGRDAIIVCPPTFGMYAVAAATQDARVVQAPLTPGFELDVPKLEQLIDAGAKILWLCSPNNPTGHLLNPFAIETLLELTRDRCLVVIDEAYAEYATSPSWITRLSEYPQLVVLRTLSKAYGLAGARIGTVIALPAIIALLRKIVPPYALSSASIDEALRVLGPSARAVVRSRIALTLAERQRVAEALAQSPFITKVHRSDSNFVLVESRDSAELLARLSDIGILVRDFTGRGGLGNAVRITIGTPNQNDRVIQALRSSTPRNVNS
ncbi:MAG: histidinol-phosphate transaminase [Gammaproteobacteria bacterium]